MSCHLSRRKNDRPLSPRRRRRPRRVVATGRAAVSGSAPLAASMACRRILSASRSTWPGADRAARPAKTAANTRLMPRRMSVADIGAT